MIRSEHGGYDRPRVATSGWTMEMTRMGEREQRGCSRNGAAKALSTCVGSEGSISLCGRLVGVGVLITCFSSWRLARLGALMGWVSFGWLRDTRGGFGLGSIWAILL